MTCRLHIQGGLRNVVTVCVKEMTCHKGVSGEWQSHLPYSHVLLPPSTFAFFLYLCPCLHLDASLCRWMEFNESSGPESPHAKGTSDQTWRPGVFISVKFHLQKFSQQQKTQSWNNLTIWFQGDSVILGDWLWNVPSKTIPFPITLIIRLSLISHTDILCYFFSFFGRLIKPVFNFFSFSNSVWALGKRCESLISDSICHGIFQTFRTINHSLIELELSESTHFKLLIPHCFNNFDLGVGERVT